MGRLVAPAIFGLATAAVVWTTVEAVSTAVQQPHPGPWLIVVFTALKACVIACFLLFSIRRGSAARPARSTAAFLACAAALGSVAPLRPPAHANGSVHELVALGLATVGAGWMVVSVLALGRCFGILPEARGLVVRGPYRLVRHPLYLGEGIVCVGLVGAHPAMFNLALLACFVAAQAVRMRLEEAALAREFPAYEAYRRSTPAVVPRLGLRAARAASEARTAAT